MVVLSQRTRMLCFDGENAEMQKAASHFALISWDKSLAL